MNKLTKEERFAKLEKFIDNFNKNEKNLKYPGYGNERTFKAQSEDALSENRYTCKVRSIGIKRKSFDSIDSPKTSKVMKKNDRIEEEKRILKTLDNFFSVVKNIPRKGTNKTYGRKPDNKRFSNKDFNAEDTETFEKKKIDDPTFVLHKLNKKLSSRPNDDALRKCYSTQNYGESAQINKEESSMPTTSKEISQAEKKITFNQVMNAAFERMDKAMKRKILEEKQKNFSSLLDNTRQNKLLKNEISDKLNSKCTDNLVKIVQDINVDKNETDKDYSFKKMESINCKIGIENSTVIVEDGNNSNNSHKMILKENFKTKPTFSRILNNMRQCRFLNNKENAKNENNTDTIQHRNLAESNLNPSTTTKNTVRNDIAENTQIQKVVIPMANRNNVTICEATTQTNSYSQNIVTKLNDPVNVLNLSRSIPQTNFYKEFNEPQINQQKLINIKTGQICFAQDLLPLKERKLEHCKTDLSQTCLICNMSKQSHSDPQTTQNLVVGQKLASQTLQSSETIENIPPVPRFFLKETETNQKLVVEQKLSSQNLRNNEDAEKRIVLKDLLPSMNRSKLKQSETFTSEIFDCKDIFSETQSLSMSQTPATEIIETWSNIHYSATTLLQDEMLYSILSRNYDKCQRLKMRGNTNNVVDEQPKKCYIKRYRKGNIQIYRLQKQKKISKTNKTQDTVKKSSLDDLFKELTQGPDPYRNCKKNQSMSSVSTSSSYITDETKSEVLSNGSELESPKKRLRKGINEISKDKSLLYCKSEYEDIPELSKNEIMEKIREFLLEVFEDLKNGRCAKLMFRRQVMENCVLKDGRLQYQPYNKALMTTVKSLSKGSHSKFKLILYVMHKILDLLEMDAKITKRELYYQLKNLVNDQSCMDRAVNIISSYLDIGVWKMNITVQKGLIFGNLKIILASGETINCNVPGTLIPQDISEIIEIHSKAYFILVVEKESIFQKLIEDDLPNKLTRPFILITGKGFPDLNTQLLLRKLWITMSIPVFILVDADPHGIQIMMNYKFGSLRNAHISQHLAVPKAKWLGVYPSDILKYSLTTHDLTKNDLRFAKQLLKTPYMEAYPKIANELNILIENNYKASIEGLLKSEVFLTDVYLPHKLYHHNFI